MTAAAADAAVLVARPATARAGRRPVTARLRDGALGALALLAVAALWEAYKALGPQDGWVVGEDVRLAPRTSDLAMPHTWDVLARLVEPITAAPGAPPLAVAVLQACAFSLGIALLSWTLGVVVGMVLALAMARVRVAEQAVLPLVVLSQTVPLIALAPLVKGWGSKLELGFEWQGWMSVAVIASYLAFFPVAVGALRGLQSPDAIHRDLLRAYGVGWWAGVVRLRLPASVPHLLPALRLAAANAVVGTVVAEVSTGLPGGVGRMILEFANFASSDPAKPWAPLLGAVLLGLVVAGLVAALGVPLARFRRAEVAA